MSASFFVCNDDDTFAYNIMRFSLFGLELLSLDIVFSFSFYLKWFYFWKRTKTWGVIYFIISQWYLAQPMSITCVASFVLSFLKRNKKKITAHVIIIEEKKSQWENQQICQQMRFSVHKNLTYISVSNI